MMESSHSFRRRVLAVCRKEICEALRDRRALISMFVIPTVVMPALLLAVGLVMAKVVRRAQAEVAPVAVVGGAHAPELVDALRADARLSVVDEAGDFRRMVQDGVVRAALEIPADFDEALSAGRPAAVTLHFNEGDLKSTIGTGELERCVRAYHDRVVAERLAARGAAASVIHPFDLLRENAAPERKAGNLLGGLLPYVIILLCFTGAMYPAIDITAGEKERGTLEGLLCCPVPRTVLVAGKFLAVLSAALATVLCTLVAMVGWFVLGGAVLLAPALASADAAGGILSVAPGAVVGVFVMIFPLAVLFSALLLAVGVYARSAKEAQTYVSPLVFVIILPAMLGMLPGVELGPRLALVPVLNVTLACRQMLSGSWHWLELALIFGSTALYAVAALSLTVHLFRRETVLFRT